MPFAAPAAVKPVPKTVRVYPADGFAAVPPPAPVQTLSAPDVPPPAEGDKVLPPAALWTWPTAPVTAVKAAVKFHDLPPAALVGYLGTDAAAVVAVDDLEAVVRGAGPDAVALVCLAGGDRIRCLAVDDALEARRSDSADGYFWSLRSNPVPTFWDGRAAATRAAAAAGAVGAGGFVIDAAAAAACRNVAAAAFDRIKAVAGLIDCFPKRRKAVPDKQG